VFIALYAPTSSQRLLDFTRIAYAFNATPVIVKPIGAAAQIGVPEAFRSAYKQGRPFIVLPGLEDLVGTLGVSEAYYVSKHAETTVSAANLDWEKTVVVINDGEYEPSRKELAGMKIVRISEVPGDLPATGLAAILLYLSSNKK
jgi:SpoU rRNA methylase family enzyme